MTIPRFFKTTRGKILLGVVIFLVVLRIALPFIMLHYANKSLASMNGYYGHVNDIDVALLRGAYVLDSFYLNKLDTATNKQTEFLSARMIDLSIEWKALFSGKIVGELVFERPILRFTKDKTEPQQVAKDTSDFRDLLNDFMPVKVNRVELRNGSISYLDHTTTPKVDVALTHLSAVALNLRNAYSSKEVLPSTLEASGNVYEGNIRLSMKLNPLADRPTFDLNTTVERTNLVKLNDFFKAYAGFDVNRGEFNMYAEAATKDGKFNGYVKPIIHNLDIVEWQGQDKKDNFFQKIWESVVDGAAEVLENQREDQFGTKISFRGDLDKPRTYVLDAVIVVLQNAFIEALRPSIDNQINLSRVGEKEGEKKGFFKSLFGSDKKEKEKKKKKEN